MSSFLPPPPVRSTGLSTLSACTQFINSSTPYEIALQLHNDKLIMHSAAPGILPSLLAHALPAAAPASKSKRATSTHPGSKNLALDVANALYKIQRKQDSRAALAHDACSDGDGDDRGEEAAGEEEEEDQEQEEEDPTPDLLGPKIKFVIYSDLLSSLRQHLASAMDEWQAQPQPPQTGFDPEVPATGGIRLHLIPTQEDYISALKVLSHLQSPETSSQHPRGKPTPEAGIGEAITPSTPLSTVLSTIQLNLELSRRPTSAASSRHTQSSSARSPPHRKRLRSCYICAYALISSPTDHQKIYPSLCAPCAAFNLSCLSLTLPENLRLDGRTAVVTGARVNLGYFTALRLLRCGARVLITTRYPCDAKERYAAEKDAAEWEDRLRIVGADFRSARDAFGLVAAVKRWLWEVSGGAGGGDAAGGKQTQEEVVGKLDILINNAAQTLTDRVEKEGEMVHLEEELEKNNIIHDGGDGDGDATESTRIGSKWLLGHNNSSHRYYKYTPRIRGGVKGLELENPPSSSAARLIELPDHPNPTTPSPPATATTTTLTHPPPPPHKSSWAQSLPEIPYLDILTAHSINAFVPLILLRELLPHLSLPRPSTSPSPSPNGYILNISSRESLRELHPHHQTKSGHHVHTNMSKAALNMLTHTEAGVAWMQGRVAVNSVDPGYMSADAEFLDMVRERRRRGGRRGGGKARGKAKGGNIDDDGIGECPLSWEDGVGRVLWVVAKGEKGEGPIWGRFLKHFTAVRTVG